MQFLQARLSLASVLTTIAGSPSEVSFYFTVSSTTYSTDYLTGHTSVAGTLYAEGNSSISFALADTYANPVAFSASVTGVTITSSGGDLLAGATLDASLACGAASTTFRCPTSGNSLPFPLTSGTGVVNYVNYVQSSLYGATSSISATITTSSGTFTGTSGSIITSTLDTALEAPQVFNDTLTAQTPAGVHSAAPGDALVEAGTPVYVVITLSPVQQGVPITLNFCPACSGTSTGYNTAVSGLIVSETLFTNSSGMVEEHEPINLTIGATAVFNATMAAPETISTTNTINGAGLSIPVYTTVGAIATLVINVAATTNNASPPEASGPNVSYLGVGATGYVGIAYADSYGNLIPLGDAPTTQVQVTLAATSGGLLSATNIYIYANQVNSNATSAQGSVELTMPSTAGTTVTLTATGVVSGKSVVGTTSIKVVSDSPIINVTSPVPVSGGLYSHSLETIFKGTANASLGLPGTDIATIGYKVGTAQWYQVSTALEHNVTWSIPLILSAGLNTAMFNATDNESPALTTVIGPFTVLVDTSAPTLSAPTAISTSSVGLNITSAEGDLNATTVAAWANGTTIPSSDIKVSGTNKPGSSVTYAVAINPPVAGTWSLTVNATSLAGLTGTVTGVVTTTTSSTPQSSTTFSLPSTASSCTLGTYNAVCITVDNTQTTAETGIVLVVLHNAAGQTIAVATSTANAVAAGSSSTVYVVVNVPAGTYSANVFVWSSTGVPISPEQTNVSITVA